MDALLRSLSFLRLGARAALRPGGEAAVSGERDDGSNRIRNKKGEKVTQFSFLSGFSEYVVIPEDGCIPLDADIDLPKVPVVGCRAPTGIGAVINTARVVPGSTALVVGLGGVGFNVIQGLKLAGAHLIIAADIVDKKQWALEWGATHYIDAARQDIVDEVMKITGIGVDYAFDAIGRGDVQSKCVAAVHKGGRVVWVGVAPVSQKSVDLDAMNITLYQKTAGGTCYGGASPFEMVPQIMRLYRAGIVKLDELVTRYLQPRADQRRLLRHARRQEHLRRHPDGLEERPAGPPPGHHRRAPRGLCPGDAGPSGLQSVIGSDGPSLPRPRQTREPSTRRRDRALPSCRTSAQPLTPTATPRRRVSRDPAGRRAARCRAGERRAPRGHPPELYEVSERSPSPVRSARVALNAFARRKETR